MDLESLLFIVVLLVVCGLAYGSTQENVMDDQIEVLKIQIEIYLLEADVKKCRGQRRSCLVKRRRLRELQQILTNSVRFVEVGQCPRGWAFMSCPEVSLCIPEEAITGCNEIGDVVIYGVRNANPKRKP